jgi:hypothetical protein
VTLHLEVLPSAQRQFWDDFAGSVPRHFVLYGGTAIALRIGHRQSVDFDFFTDRAIEEQAIRAAIPILHQATSLQVEPNTVSLSLALTEGPVQLSFFGGLRVGRVGTPQRVRERPALASRLDLLAMKLKVLQNRIEPRDYLDIEALLRSGLSLTKGIAAARALFGPALNPLDTAKAVAWFKDGGLEERLPERTRDFLARASARIELDVAPMPVKSRSLA